jgi:hypothetical protein
VILRPKKHFLMGRPKPDCLKAGAGLGILFGIVARAAPPHVPRRGGFGHGFWALARPIDSLKPTTLHVSVNFCKVTLTVSVVVPSVTLTVSVTDYVVT